MAVKARRGAGVPSPSRRVPLSIAEVVQRTGVPAATVHHYRRLGLLPPPERIAPNRFLYDERHVQALLLVRALRERRRLSLSEIRRVLPELTGLGDQDAFRPEMWDEAVGLHLRKARARSPRTRLLDAGRRAFARHGFADVRVDDVCRTAKVAKGSFYRHFRSKEDLYFAACAAAAEEVSAAFVHHAPTRRMPEDEAAVLLARCLEPQLPLLLDLVARALQRHPGHVRVAQQVLAGLADSVAGRLQGPRDGAAGARVLERAANRVVASVLCPRVIGPGLLGGAGP